MSGARRFSINESADPVTWRHERYSHGAFSHAHPTEHERLRLLESILDQHSREKLRDLGVGPGWRCLEVGAGGGSVARWMASQGAQVTATDLDTKFLDQTNEPRITVLQHDMYADDFPSGSFDLIHTRYVLVHLPDQDKAISRLISWLTPRGLLVVEEPAFFPIQNAPHPAYRAVMRAFRDYLETHVGTSTEWARELPVTLAGKGLADIEMQARIQKIRGGDAEARWWRLTLEQARSHIVAQGAVPDEAFDLAYAELADPDFQDLSLAVFTAWGRRT